MKAGHIDDETLAALAEGSLKRAEIDPLLGHLENCELCTRALETAVDVHNAENERSRRGPWWLAVAAIVVLVAVAVPVWRRRAGGDGIERLVAAAPRSARLVEPRLSRFPWAAYRGPARANDKAADAEQLKVGGAAAEVIETADRTRSADAQHAAGVALVLVDDQKHALDRLSDAAARQSSNAAVWSDLAAARYAAAARLGRPSLYPEALAAADRALAIDPHLPEALFNRALIVEKLGLIGEARAAWKRYLDVDASSPWATEARAHLAALGGAAAPPFRRELPALERAAVAGDAAAVRGFAVRFPQECRTFAEAEYLGRWGDALRRGDVAEAAHMLSVARSVGAALAQTNRESLLRDAVAAIDTASAAVRQELAEAHATYRQGRITYSRQRPSEAEPLLRRAAALFAAGGSPMAIVARYYAANTRFDQDDAGGARTALEPLLGDARRRGYAALAAQIEWELGLCATVDGDWAGAIASLRDGEETFGRLGERTNEAFLTSLLAQSYASLGRAEEAWTSWMRAFRTISSDPRTDRLPVALNDAVISEARAGRRENALALLRLAAAAARAAGDDALLANVLQSQTVLEADLGDRLAAARTLGEMTALLPRIEDGRVRAHAAANADLAAGAVFVASDARRAVAHLSSAAAAYETAVAAMLPEALLLRARASLHLGDAAAAGRDLDRGIDTVERHWIDYAGPVAGTGVVDAAPALFEDAIRLRLAANDVAGAFVYAERARTQFGSERGGTTIAAVQQQLRGSGAAVLELVTTPAEVIAFAVRENGVTVTRTAFDRARAGALSRPSLYDVLIRPSAAAIDGARELIVVPDAWLQAVPFAALDDGKGPLVARMPVAIAASAASLRAEESAPQRRGVLAIALPAGEAAGTIALPETGGELADVASIHRGARLIDPSHATFDAFVAASREASIIHIAGHSDEGEGETALVFSGDHRATWKSIAGSRLGAPDVVVLAACETLRPPGPHLRALSLGHAFSAAGAANVVGTLQPVRDADARAIFGAFHRELAAGASAAVALQRAQLDAFRHGNAAWPDVALLTTRVAR